MLSGVDSGWRLQLAPRPLWGRAWVCSATRRGAMDRSAAIMIFANWDRSSATRRLLPQNLGARGSFEGREAGYMAGEGLVCCGGAPARRGEHGHHGADRTVTVRTVISI